MKFRIGLGQMCSGQDKRENIENAQQLVSELAERGAELVMLPENFSYVGPDHKRAEQAEFLDQSPTLEVMRELAIRLNITLHIGSFLEQLGSHIYNTSIVFDPNGQEVALYRKIHLFDVDVPGGRCYRESDVITAGSEVVSFACNDFVFGLAICYDLRFPELFRKLSAQGVNVLLLPAAFTLQTGRDHWEVLLRARAIENLCWLAAAGQWGKTMPDTPCFGRSMVVNPWGIIVAQAPDGVGGIVADLDLSQLEEIRSTFPALQHRRTDIV